MADSYQLLSERAKVAQHLPSLTTRFAENRLGALAVASGRELRGTPEVLFICVQNAGRSQMAAALLRQMAGDRVHVRTAGSRPASQVDPAVVAALDEIGVPVTAEFPKPLTDEVVQAADFVITMGCGDACPVYSGRRYMDWPIADPVGRPCRRSARSATRSPAYWGGYARRWASKSRLALSRRSSDIPVREWSRSPGYPRAQPVRVFGEASAHICAPAVSPPGSHQRRRWQRVRRS